MNRLFEVLEELPQPQKSNEWYTPSKYIEAAREVMGGIDLDPASCELANKTVKATRYYTKEQDGLSKPWYGRVWLNPPYGTALEQPGQRKSNIRAFTERCIAEYKAGNIEQSTMLVRADPCAYWFPQLWEFLICFVGCNFYFNGPYGKVKHQFGTAFVYLGPNEQKFIEIFSQFGRVAKAIDVPKHRASQPTLWDSAIPAIDEDR